MLDCSYPKKEDSEVFLSDFLEEDWAPMDSTTEKLKMSDQNMIDMEGGEDGRDDLG